MNKYVRGKKQIIFNKDDASTAITIKFICLTLLITISILIFYIVQG